MLAHSKSTQILIATLLIVMLVTTRGNHFATLQLLPSASWAVFFLAGIYLRPFWVLPALLVFVWGLDFTPYLIKGLSLSEVFSGGKVFCLTPSYAFLWPAYACLWLAGNEFTKRVVNNWSDLRNLALAVLIGAACCQIISSGGFYFFSGRFAEPTLIEFISRLIRFFPGYLQSLVFYVAVAATIHGLFLTASTADGANRSETAS